MNNNGQPPSEKVLSDFYDMASKRAGHRQISPKLTIINSGSSLDRLYIRNVRSYDNKRASHLISATEDMTKHLIFQLFSNPADRKF